MTLYQHYKIETVSPFLLEAMEKIKKGMYGICKYCGKEILVGKLLLVPPSFQCMDCENSK
jgi:RNA polymerase-binding transcription factor DksA